MDCAVEGCSRRAKARGLCLMHYKRWRKHGDPGHALPRGEQPTKQCSICGGRGKIVRDLCAKHYTRLCRTGTTELVSGATERGTVEVEIVVYRGTVFRRYPDARQPSHRRYFKPNGKAVARGIEALHREIYKDTHGPIPPGHHVHHIDGDFLNNDPANLEALPAGKHTKHHHPKGEPASDAQRAHLDRIRPLAAAWHRSPEGRAWHRKHSKHLQAINARRRLQSQDG